MSSDSAEDSHLTLQIAENLITLPAGETTLAAFADLSSPSSVEDGDDGGIAPSGIAGVMIQRHLRLSLPRQIVTMMIFQLKPPPSINLPWLAVLVPRHL